MANENYGKFCIMAYEIRAKEGESNDKRCPNLPSHRRFAASKLSLQFVIRCYKTSLLIIMIKSSRRIPIIYWSINLFDSIFNRFKKVIPLYYRRCELSKGRNHGKEIQEHIDRPLWQYSFYKCTKIPILTSTIKNRNTLSNNRN